MPVPLLRQHAIPGAAPGSRCRPSDGFTLVELLVVIGIISVLAAMLLPALHRALESARGIACLSQERQLYLGIDAVAGEQTHDYSGRWLNYCDDGRGDPASPRFCGGVRAKYWTEFIRVFYYGGRTTWEGLKNHGYTQAKNERDGGGNFLCPSDRAYQTATPTTDWYWVWGDSFSRYASYALNCSTFGWYGLPPKRTQLQSPSRTILLVEGGIGTCHCAVQTTLTGVPAVHGRRMSVRHLDRSSVLYTDGHASAQSLQDIWFSATAWYTMNAEQKIRWHGRDVSTCDPNW